MLSKDFHCLMFVTKGIFLYILGVYIIKLSVNTEIICVFNKHHILFRRYSSIGGDIWKIVCSVGVGLSKHGYGKMSPKKAHVLVLGIFHKVHCMTTCKEFEE